MGKVWFQTSDGKNIHIPVVGNDINSPANPIVLSGVALALQNRCLSGQIVIVHPTFGSITLDFSAPNRTGSCNQCGQCCTHSIALCQMPPGQCGYILDAARGVHKCQHLTIFPKGIGKANGTECSVRATILDVLKGCTLFPSKAADIANCPDCQFTFGGG